MKNKLVLGTVQLGLDYGINNQLGKPSLEKSFEILNTAFDNGITTLDTAEAYGDSQDVIGKFLKENQNKSFNIITKLAADSTVQPKEFVDHIVKNCETLNIKQLYGYMFHNYLSFKNRINLYDKLLMARENGLVTKVGISLYKNHEIEDVLKYYNGFDFIQIPFNLFDNASKRKHLLKIAKEKNIEIHTRSVFLQGLFFKKKEELPKQLQSLKSYLKTLDDIIKTHAINLETLALQYVLQKEYIDHVLIGVETSDQLIKNINISNQKHSIPHDLIDNLNVKEKELLNPSNWIK